MQAKHRTLGIFLTLCVVGLAAILLFIWTDFGDMLRRPEPIAAASATPHSTPASILEPDGETSAQTFEDAIASNRQALEALNERVAVLEARVELLERALAAHPANSAPPEPSLSAPDVEGNATSAPSLLIPTATPQPTSPVSAESRAPEPLVVELPAGSGLPDEAILWSQAWESIDATVTVCGPVAAAQFAHQSNGQPTFLNIGKAFPAPDRFQVVIWGNNRANFPTPPEVLYANMTICATGVVGEFRGTVEMTVAGPDAITIVE